MPISEAHGAIFCHIPKTGGQSITEALECESLKTKYRGWNLAHLTMVQIIARLGLKDTHGMTSVAVVRNPFDRMVSEWLWRARAKTRFLPVKEGESLTSWLKRVDKAWSRGLIDKANHNDSCHFLCQTDYVVGEQRFGPSGTRLLVDNLFYFERWGAVETWIKGRTGRVVEKLNASEDREGDFRAYYTPAAREIVERRYESDFRAFQYGWDEEDCITSSLIWRDPFEPPADLTEYG